MTWILYIDDERLPDTPKHVARSALDAILMVGTWGVPTHIDFDYDLKQDTVEPFVEWFLAQVDACELILPANFTWSVHSSNPKGAVWLDTRLQYLDRFIDRNA